MNSSAIIFGGGEIPNNSKLKDFSKDKIIICADSGYDKIKNLDIKVDYLLGDFDSIESDVKKLSGAEIVVFPPEKDYTDMEIAINKAIELNVDTVYIFGGLGGRVDHSLINIGLLIKLQNNNIKGYILDSINKVQISKGETKVLKENYKYLSIIPLYDNTVISLDGVKYPLNNHIVNIGYSLTVSNEITDKIGTVISDKNIIIIQSKDK